MKDKSTIRRIIVISFLVIPLLSATISAFHVERFMRLGNPNLLSISTSVAYEISSLSIMVILVLIPNVKQTLVWTAFILLVFMQIIGNIYYAYDYIYVNIADNPMYVANFTRMVNTFMVVEPSTCILILSCLIGAPVPIIALLLTKSTSDYFKDPEQEAKENEGKPVGLTVKL